VQQEQLLGYVARGCRSTRPTATSAAAAAAPVLTGPAFITKDNVDAVAKFAAKGTR